MQPAAPRPLEKTRPQSPVEASLASSWTRTTLEIAPQIRYCGTLEEPMRDDDPFLTSLLYEDESPTLDFKSEQYPCATDEQKGELIKDILAFTNAWRHADAYILTGVKDNPASPATVVGVTNHLKDADLQQLVNSKTNQPVSFSYRSAQLDDKGIGVLHIPVQDRPRFITRPFGKLSAGTVYLRRGSSTAVALPDEIASMGAAHTPQTSPVLQLQFADTMQHRLTGHTQAIHATCLEISNFEAVPDYKEPPSIIRDLSFSRTNKNYLRELISHACAQQLCTALQFAITNSGPVVATDVRVELFVQSPNAVLFDEDSWPKEPEPRTELFSRPSLSDLRMKDDDEITVQQLPDCSRIVNICTSKIQPGETKWIERSLFLGSRASGDIVLDGTIRADNIPTPQPTRLKVTCNTEHRETTWKTVVNEASQEADND